MRFLSGQLAADAAVASITPPLPSKQVANYTAMVTETECVNNLSTVVTSLHEMERQIAKTATCRWPVRTLADYRIHSLAKRHKTANKTTHVTVNPPTAITLTTNWSRGRFSPFLSSSFFSFYFSLLSSCPLIPFPSSVP